MSDCDAIIDRLIEGDDPSALFARHATHLEHCTSCRRLLAADDALMHVKEPLVTQGASLRMALERDLAAVRRRPIWQRVALPVGALIAVVFAGATMLGRPTITTATSWLASLVLLGVACGGVAMVLHRTRSGLGVPVTWRRGYMALSFALFAVSTWLTTKPSPSFPRLASSVQQPWGLSAVDAVSSGRVHAVGPMNNVGACASSGLVFAGAIALATLWSARRTVPVSSGSMGAVVGVASGLAATAALQLSCASHTAHALAAHGLPLVVAAVLCTFLGRRALAP